MPSFFLMIRRPPRSPLFPYTTLSRSGDRRAGRFPGRRGPHARPRGVIRLGTPPDRKSTRLNSSHSQISYAVFFFNDTAPTEISPLPLHDALPIGRSRSRSISRSPRSSCATARGHTAGNAARSEEHTSELQSQSNLVCRLFF